jgi:hypothetical protein
MGGFLQNIPCVIYPTSFSIDNLQAGDYATYELCKYPKLQRIPRNQYNTLLMQSEVETDIPNEEFSVQGCVSNFVY